MKQGWKRNAWKAIAGIILIALCMNFAAGHIEFIRAFITAQEKGIQHAETQILKRGYYCGEGGMGCHHGEGYIFCEKGLSKEEVMELVEFEELGNGEYLDGPDSLEIAACIPCINGWLLCYQVTGAW